MGPSAVMPFGMLSFGFETAVSEDSKENRHYKMAKEQNLRLPFFLMVIISMKKLKNGSFKRS